MKAQVTYFDSIKDDNTLATFELAKARAKEQNIRRIVLASTTGATAQRAMDFFEGSGISLVVVPHQYGFSADTNRFPAELVKKLEEHGHRVHFGTMLFHTDRLFGCDTPTVVANFLRCFCEGVKVCYEIALMAADAGLIEPEERIIAIAGTGRNSDTALLMTAATSRKLENLRINEILCKPYDRSR